MAHPYRYVGHNGEINTLLGNCNWMRAREKMLASDLISPPMGRKGIERMFPILNEEGRDLARAVGEPRGDDPERRAF